MGGFSDQPYIYEPQNRRIAYPYSDFNPKAVTQASYQRLQQQKQSPEKKKQDGPLINFNQHPDSYMIVAGQNVNYKPMSPNTKKKVTVIRWIQLAFRIMEEIGALGMLVCVICIKGMVTSMAWITRIAPAWDAVITIYAIYHLARSPKARPPMSSASYHMFAIFMDVGLIPFYVFIGIFANNNLLLEPKNKQRWTSFFTGEGQTNTLLLSTFIGAFVVAALHAVSTFFDLWLVILFRKIAKLPPDLNPLEDNLTSRKSSSKHKYKNSEATLTGSIDEKNHKYLSGSTLNVDDQSRLSTVVKDVPDTRQVPFRHSRTGSELGYSPHNPDSARWCRQNMEGSIYQQPQSTRGSMASVRPHTRGNSISPSKAAFTMTETPPTPTHSSRPMSYPKNQSAGMTLDSNRFSTPALPNAAPSNALVRSQQQNSLLSSNNWVALDDDENDGADLGSPDRYRRNYEDENTIERHDSFQPQPLKMNPPTPPPPATKDRYYAAPDRNALGVRTDHGNGSADLNRHLTVKSDATMSSSVYSESSPELKSSKISPGTPKSKYYGDLAAATRGVRGGAYKSNETLRSTGTVDASGFDATGMSAMGGYGYSYADPPSPSKAGKKNKPSYPVQQNSPAKSVHASTTYKSNDTLRSTGTVDAAGYDATGESALGSYGFCPSPPPKVPRLNRDAKGRVISRSGVDLADASQHMVDAARAQGFGAAGGRRRDVSGKVAEEGRGGGESWAEGASGWWRRY